MKQVFRITTPEVNQLNGYQRFINFECDYTSVDHLADDLASGKLVLGMALLTRPTDQPQTQEVVRRHPMALGRERVASIEIPFWRFVEYEPEPAT